MAATKASKTTGWSSTSQAAGTGPTTGTAIDLTTAYGANITVQVVTTTAPTSAGTVFISTSVDNTTWVTWATGTVGLAASATYNYGWELPPSMAYVRVDITSGTGTGVTVSAQCEALTGL
jgi:hypothetical protein